MQELKKKVKERNDHLLKKIKKYEPLEIKISLQSPLSISHPFLHFDGLVAHLLLKKCLSDDYYSLPSKEPIDFGLRLPIKKTLELYHASVSFFDAEIMDIITRSVIYKRFYENPLLMKKIKNKAVEIGKGMFKNFLISLAVFPIKNLNFYCNADKKIIEDLMQDLTTLGKKTSIGYGFIDKIEIKKIKHDYSIIKNNVCMRPIPISYLEHYDEITKLAWKPPYWDKRNVRLCSIPFTNVRLRYG